MIMPLFVGWKGVGGGEGSFFFLLGCGFVVVVARLPLWSSSPPAVEGRSAMAMRSRRRIAPLLPFFLSPPLPLPPSLLFLLLVCFFIPSLLHFHLDLLLLPPHPHRVRVMRSRRGRRTKRRRRRGRRQRQRQAGVLTFRFHLVHPDDDGGGSDSIPFFFLLLRHPLLPLHRKTTNEKIRHDRILVLRPLPRARGNE